MDVMMEDEKGRKGIKKWRTGRRWEKGGIKAEDDGEEEEQMLNEERMSEDEDKLERGRKQGRDGGEDSDE